MSREIVLEIHKSRKPILAYHHSRKSFALDKLEQSWSCLGGGRE